MKPIYLSRDQVRQVDRRAIAEFGVPKIILIKNASRNAARVARRRAAVGSAPGLANALS